jgi:hypothetical protein
MKKTPRKRIRRRYCRGCEKELPASNWNYCSKCKESLFGKREEEFPYQSAYRLILDTAYLDYL